MTTPDPPDPLDAIVAATVSAIAEDTSGADVGPSAWRDHYCALLDRHIRAALTADRERQAERLYALRSAAQWAVTDWSTCLTYPPCGRCARCLLSAALAADRPTP